MLGKTHIETYTHIPLHGHLGTVAPSPVNFNRK